MKRNLTSMKTVESVESVGWSMAFITFVYMVHHFILLRLNPFDLRADREGMWFEHSVS